MLPRLCKSEMLSGVDSEILLQRAWRAREHAYAPYSKFAVGCAVQSRTVQIFGGCNVENISLGLTVCAERVAAGAAIEAGARDLVALAIVTDTAAAVVPCGACRQFLAEFNPDLTIFSAGRGSERRTWTL